MDIFTNVSLGMGVDGSRVQWILNINKSLYGLDQANENWFDPLKTGLEKRGCHQSLVEPCVIYRKYSVISTYVDDCVIVLHKQYTTTSLI